MTKLIKNLCVCIFTILYRCIFKSNNVYVGYYELTAQGIHDLHELPFRIYPSIQHKQPLTTHLHNPKI